MLVRQLLNSYAQNIPDNLLVGGLSLNSKSIKQGDLFFALSGHKFDAKQFVFEAIERGAVAIVSEQLLFTSLNVPQIVIPNLREQLSFIAKKFYAYPAENTSITGVTGTNGKTSITYFLSFFLTQFSKKNAIIGTLGWGELNNLQSSDLTTPDPFKLFQYLHTLDEAGCREIVMEVSSIALDQHRVDAVNFDYAVFTNLQHDHLDYHLDMGNYGKAKERLFLDLEVKTSIINVDDVFGKVLLNKLANISKISYGYSDHADLRIVDVHCAGNMTKVMMNIFGQNIEFETNLCGVFNIYNLSAVLATLLSKGYQLLDILPFFKMLPSVPGRMQRIDTNKGWMVIIDYAHTPDALKVVLQTIKRQFNGKIWCVFGCGGSRDKEKRPIMGRYASEFADYVILTSDNPRNEDPKNIVCDILKGIDDQGNCTVELDRKKAIYFALSQAKANEIVLIAGRGHEQYQIFKDYYEPFNDYKVVMDFLYLNQNII